MNILKKHFMCDIVMFQDWDGKSVVIQVSMFMPSIDIQYINANTIDEYNDILTTYQNQCLSRIIQIHKTIKISFYINVAYLINIQLLK